MDATAPRRAYRSDLTDAEWDIIRPYVPAVKPGPNPAKYTRREIVNGIRYKLRTGCQWEYLPHDLPPWKSVSDYYYLWRDDGTWTRLVDALRPRVRLAEGRDPDPTLAIVDSQTVKTTEVGGTVGYDGGKKIRGRKRHLVVDALGLLLVIAVTAASVSDQAMIRPLARDARATSPRLERMIGDDHYRGPMADAAGAAAGIAVEARVRSPEQTGFAPIPLRWHVEQSFGWMNRWRELSKEYTQNPRSSEAWVEIGFIGLMTRRLAALVDQTV